MENAQMLDDLKKEQQRVEYLLAQTVRAQEEERHRVAMELHDGVAQWLAGISYRLQAFGGLLAKTNNAEARPEVKEIGQAVLSTIRELRAVVVALHPPTLRRWVLLRPCVRP